MLGRRLVRRAVATAVAAGAALVAVLALGVAVYCALALVIPPLAAAAITFLLFAVLALLVALLFVRAAEDDEEEPEGEFDTAGLGMRAYQLFRQRPILGTVAALAGGWIFLRNPALATMVAAAFTEKPQGRRRR